MDLTRWSDEMQIGVSPHPLGPRDGADFGRVLDTARLAERLGFDHIVAAGHVIAGTAGLTMDPIVLLSAVAGATTRVKLLTSVVVLPLYNPVVLANQVATLDALSSGRLALGVGTGWDADEFAAVGVPFDRRGPRTDEYLDVLQALWSGQSADHNGQFASFRQVTTGTPPANPGGPGIWIGGHSDAALRRALRYADAWHGTGVDPSMAVDIRRRIEVLAGETGRDPETLRLTSAQFLVPSGVPQLQQAPFPLLGGPHASAASVIEGLAALEKAGLSTCSIWMPIAADHMAEALDWLASEVLPHISIADG